MMKNLSFLKGIFVGIAIATVGAGAYAASRGTWEMRTNSFPDSWVVANGKIYLCKGYDD